MGLSLKVSEELNTPRLRSYTETAIGILELTDADITLIIDAFDDSGEVQVAGTAYEVNGRFFLAVSESISMNLQAITICHELIHIKQLVTGRLIKMNNGSLWDGVYYTKYVEHSDRPWEIEAKEHESTLTMYTFNQAFDYNASLKGREPSNLQEILC